MVRLAEKLITLDPRDDAQRSGETMAARTGGLDGKVLGLLSNNKPNSEMLLSMVAELIKDTYELKAVVEANKGTHRIPAPLAANKPFRLSSMTTHCSPGRPNCSLARL